MSLLPYASLSHRRKAYRSTDVHVLLSSQTETAASEIVFTSDITSTYGEYIFKFYNINPATDDQNFTFQTSTDGGSNYNLTTTSSYFVSKHAEDDSPASLGYEAGYDFAQSTSFIRLSVGIGNGADESMAGEFHLFNPSSTTYVKHWYSTNNMYHEDSISLESFVAGYVNSTSDIDAIQFKMESGDFSGTIKMWGVL